MSSEQSFPLDPSERCDFTREDKLKEIAREIALRRAVYRRRIRDRLMTIKDAKRAIDIMLAIARDYGGHGDA